MTLTARAEKIVRLVTIMESDHPYYHRAVAHILAELQAAVLEERESWKGSEFAANPREWFCKNCGPIFDEHMRQAAINIAAREREECAKIAKVSADYYAKGVKREDGTLNTTIASAAQTSWDIFKAIEARSESGKEGV